MNVDEFRDDVIGIRERLRPAMWCANWATAATTVHQVRDELVGIALGPLMSDEPTPNEILPIGSRVVRAMRLLNRADELAGIAMADGQDPTVAARESLTKAMALLDEVS